MPEASQHREEQTINTSTIWMNLQIIMVSEKANPKGCILYDSNYMTFLKWQVGLSGGEVEWGSVAIKKKGNTTDSWGGGMILYLDSGGGYMNLHVIKLYRTKHTYTNKYK